MNFDRQRKILILDNDRDFTDLLVKTLSSFNYELNVTHNGADFVSQVKTFNPDVITIDLEMSGVDYEGVEIFRMMTYDVDRRAKVIIYSRNEKASWLSVAYKIGNFNLYMNATLFSLSELIKQINNAAYTSKQEEETLAVQIKNYTQKQKIVYSHPFIGESESTRNTRQQIARLAKADEDMFVVGETGTGKEVAAYYYYLNSSRFGKPILTVNCSALNETLIESELYGHIKGSFTSAEKTKLGLFEQSSDGVLFLDEITNMSLSAQSKLLRSIENKEIQIVGGEAKKVNTKLIFASNASLDVLSKPDVIRKDLFYRIESNIIEILPLRERKDDIILLMNHFLARYSKPGLFIDYSSTVDVQDILLSYTWPGNVRELKNFCKSLLINESEINSNIIRKNFEVKLKNRNQQSIYNTNIYKSANLKESMGNFEKEYLLLHLNQNNWQINKTARSIGIERTTLYKKIKYYRLQPVRSV